MKKLLSFLICTAFILSIIPISVFAAGETSGQCGDNLTWSYNTETATLTISGTGSMYNYDCSRDYRPSPWYQYHSSIKNVSIGNDVTSIGREAFYYCISLKKIYYPGSKEEWNRINLQNSCIPSDAEIIYNAAGCDANIHSLGEWIAEVPETCTKDGVMEHYECSVCHKYFDKDKNEITDLAIPAHHTPVLLKKIPLTH